MLTLVNGTNLFHKVGALAVSGQREDENPHDGELTFLGRVLAQLPVSQQLGKLIVLGHVFGCLDECLIIGKCGDRCGQCALACASMCWHVLAGVILCFLFLAAALSLKNFFTMPFRQHLDGYRYLILSLWGSPS